MIKDGEVKSALLVEFNAPNDVRFESSYMGEVHPGQIIYACEMLIVMAKNQILNELARQQQLEAEKQQMNKIVTPKAVFVPPEN